jgi:hypothetical protein
VSVDGVVYTWSETKKKRKVMASPNESNHLGVIFGKKVENSPQRHRGHGENEIGID